MRKFFKEVYTITQAAKMLKMNRMTCYLKVRTGVIKGFKIGEFWHITDIDLLKYLNHR